MTHEKLLRELAGIVSAFEHECGGIDQVSMSLQILPGGRTDLAGPIYAWDGTHLVELPEGVGVR